MAKLSWPLPELERPPFEPQMVAKGQTRITSMDDQILCLYVKGMSTRDSVVSFQELYGADGSAGLISKVTGAAMDPLLEWQSLPLEVVYPTLYLDCIVIKVRQDKRVINK